MDLYYTDPAQQVNTAGWDIDDLDLEYCTDPAHNLTTAGQDLDDIDHDLDRDLSDVWNCFVHVHALGYPPEKRVETPAKMNRTTRVYVSR